MTLDAEAQWVLDLVAERAYPTMDTLEPAEARAQFEKTAKALDAKPRPMAEVEDSTVNGPGGAIPIRTYVPHGCASSGAPALIYFHGGGFVVGSRNSHDGLCRALAEDSGGRLVSVDYRLAPEHPFPAAAEDCAAVARWALEHAESLGIDPARIAVGGDSAGGNLAAVVAQQLAEDARRPSFQLLVYPVTDFTAETESMRRCAEGYVLTRGLIDYFYGHYAPAGIDRRDPRLSPAFGELRPGVPPALVMTAGYDPLCDEGRAYAQRLQKAGIPVREAYYPGLIHGFLSMSGALKSSQRAMQEAAAALREAWGLAPAAAPVEN